MNEYLVNRFVKSIQKSIDLQHYEKNQEYRRKIKQTSIQKKNLSNYSIITSNIQVKKI